jgi:hypothetical protein
MDTLKPVPINTSQEHREQNYVRPLLPATNYPLVASTTGKPSVFRAGAPMLPAHHMIASHRGPIGGSEHARDTPVNRFLTRRSSTSYPMPLGRW